MILESEPSNHLNSHRKKADEWSLSLSLSAWSRPLDIPLRMPSTKASLARSWSPAWEDFTAWAPVEWFFNSNLVVLQCIGSTRPVRWLEIGWLNVTNSDKTVDRLTNSSDVLRDAHQQKKNVWYYFCNFQNCIGLVVEHKPPFLPRLR